MQKEIIVSGTDPGNTWQEIAEDLKVLSSASECHLVLIREDRRILTDIVTAESGPASTTLSSYLYNRDDFRFSIHTKGLADEIGKFFGMEDLVLGFSTFDEKFIVKTNGEERTAALFSDANIRQVFESLPDLSLGIIHYLTENAEGKVPFLELKINAAITYPEVLREIFDVYSGVLTKLDS